MWQRKPTAGRALKGVTNGEGILLPLRGLDVEK